MCLACRGQSCLCVVWGWRGWAHHCSGPVTVLPTRDHWAPPTAIVQMGKLRPRGTRTGRGGLQEQQNSPASPLARCFPSFKAWGCASGKQATSCWWQSSPAGKSSLESDFHPRLQERGMAHKFLSFSRVLVAASCRL